MINSVLASNHLYYFTFLEIPQSKNLRSLLKKHKGILDYTILNRENDNEIYHLQICTKKLFSSAILLRENAANGRDALGENMYWYDFYITSIKSETRNILIIGYPYVMLVYWIRDLIGHISEFCYSHKVVVNTILNHFKNQHIFKKRNDHLKFHISKYSARIHNENADSFDISGNNPLNSEIFDHIMQNENYRVETKRVKIAIKDHLVLTSAEFWCDRLGNISTRIKQDMQIPTVILAKKIFLFLEQIQALYKSTGLSHHLILNTEDDYF